MVNWIKLQTTNAMITMSMSDYRWWLQRTDGDYRLPMMIANYWWWFQITNYGFWLRMLLTNNWCWYHFKSLMIILDCKFCLIRKHIQLISSMFYLRSNSVKTPDSCLRLSNFGFVNFWGFEIWHEATRCCRAKDNIRLKNHTQTAWT